jgi:hypothetical protein
VEKEGKAGELVGYCSGGVGCGGDAVMMAAQSGWFRTIYSNLDGVKTLAQGVVNYAMLAPWDA